MDEEKHSRNIEKRNDISNSTNSSQGTLDEVKTKLDIKKLERKAFIEAINDYSTLITTKAVGVGSLVVGVLEFLAPNLLPLVVPAPITPLTLIGVSMGFLLNKEAILIMRNFSKIVDQNKEED